MRTRAKWEELVGIFFLQQVRLQVVVIGTLTSYDICDLLPKVKKQMCDIKWMPEESSPF